MYFYQIVVTFYSDFYGNSNYIMDTNGLIYLAPFFIIILCIVYLVRIKIFDRVYGLDLSELEETEISVFSPITDSEMKEIRDFQEEELEEEEQSPEVILEDYYRKL